MCSLLSRMPAPEMLTERAGVLVAEEVQRRAVGVGAVLLAVAVPVVVVGDAGVDLAGVDATASTTRLFCDDHAVVLEAVEPVGAWPPRPRARGRRSRSPGSRRRSGRSRRGPPTRGRRSRGSRRAGRPRSSCRCCTSRRWSGPGSRSTLPSSAGRTRPGSRPCAASGSSREQAGVVDDAHRGRVLGEEHVGGRVLALLDDLVGHLEVLAAAQLDVEAGLLLEERHDLVEELLVLGVVDDEVGRPKTPHPDRVEAVRRVAARATLARVVARRGESSRGRPYFA